MRDDDINIKPNEFFGEFRGAIASRVGIAELYLNVLTLRIPERMQSAPESIRKWGVEVTQTQALQRGALFPAAAHAPRAAKLRLIQQSP
jgi:hypothetical protein